MGHQGSPLTEATSEFWVRPTLAYRLSCPENFTAGPELVPSPELESTDELTCNSITNKRGLELAEFKVYAPLVWSSGGSCCLDADSICITSTERNTKYLKSWEMCSSSYCNNATPCLVAHMWLLEFRFVYHKISEGLCTVCDFYSHFTSTLHNKKQM